MKKEDDIPHILLVEDNLGDAFLVEELLREKFMHPSLVHATNFKQARELLKDKTTDFDVILLDLTLPDKFGNLLITEILELAPSCPIIALTGYNDLEFSIQSIAEGISDYLLKDDLSPMMLYKSMRYAIERNKTNYAIKASEKRYSDLFNLSPQPRMVLNPQTQEIIQVNKAAINHYGYEEAEFLRLTLTDIISPDYSEKTIDIILQVKPETESLKTENVVHHIKNGDRIEVDMYFSPILIDHSWHVSALIIDVTEKNQQEQRLMKAILKAQEDERYEIGRELHDNVCQILVSGQISLGVGVIKSNIEEDNQKFFTQCKDYIALALEDIRNLSHKLVPVFYEDSTLEEAIRRLLKSVNTDNRYKVMVFIDKAVSERAYSTEMQLHLYRILQEQLTNIHKYAKATTITLRISITHDVLKMTIADDGIGFNLDEVSEGIGLTNIKRRTDIFYGKTSIITSPGNGCKIDLEIPLKGNLD